MKDELREQVAELVEKATDELFDTLAIQFNLKTGDISPDMVEELTRYQEYYTNISLKYLFTNGYSEESEE